MACSSLGSFNPDFLLLSSAADGTLASRVNLAVHSCLLELAWKSTEGDDLPVYKRYARRALFEERLWDDPWVRLDGTAVIRIPSLNHT